MGHRLATDENGNYSQDLGIERIRKYATMFGLDHTSGIEFTESSPKMSTEDPERSSIGQGTNAYSNVQLSRHVAAVANSGTVFEFSLIDKVADSNGNSSWDAVTAGMRQVIVEKSAKKIFKDLEVDIAGKNGTAQESKSRANHAFFISYASFSNPDICVTVNIPYGYSSSNAATIAKNVYRFYYVFRLYSEYRRSGCIQC